MSRFNLMYQLLRLAFCRNQIKPAAGCHQLFGKPEDPVRDGIAVMVVVEKPCVDVAIAESRLDGGNVHGTDYFTRSSRSRSNAAVIPATRITLFLLAWPERIET